MAGSLTVREILTRYSFKTDTSAIKKAERSLNSLKKAAKIGAVAVGGFAAAGAKLITGFASQADRIAKTSKQLEINAQFLQAMGHAAELSGASMEDVTTGIRRLSASALEASRGSKSYTEAFAEMGVSVKDANGNLKDNEVLLLEAFEGLSQMEDGAKRVALAQRLFGRSGTKLIPVLKGGADGVRRMLDEADDLGTVLGDKALKSAEDFQDSMTRMRARIRGVASRVATSLLPVVEKLVGRLQDWFVANEDVIKSRLEQFLKAVPPILEGIGQAIKFVIENWKVLAGLAAAFVGAKVIAGIVSIASGIAAVGASASGAVVAAGGLAAALKMVVVSVGGVVAAFAGAFAVGTALDRWLGLSDMISDKLTETQRKAARIRAEAHAGDTRRLRLQQTANRLLELRKKGVESVQRSGGRGRLSLDREGISQALRDQASNLGISGDAVSRMLPQLLGQMRDLPPAGGTAPSRSVNVGAPQITVNVPPGTQASQAQRVAEAAGSATRSSMRSAIGDVAR